MAIQSVIWLISTLQAPLTHLLPDRYAEDKDSGQNFSFRCHRGEPVTVNTMNRTSETAVYSVNDISFNRLHGTFSTAGSDGSLSFW